MFKNVQRFIFLILFFLITISNVVAYSSTTNKIHNYDSVKVFQLFNSVDKNLTENNFDSAQFYINSILKSIKYRGQDYISYYLCTRQMEIYYYNSLPELGLQEVAWAIDLANTLNDSDLLLDAYNFKGLFSLMLNQYDLAIDAFNKGIQYISNSYHQHPFYLTQPQHIYANLAEVYEKVNRLKFALDANYKSLYYAQKHKAQRATMVAEFGIANIYIKQNMFDSASLHLNNALNKSKELNQLDVYTMSLVGYANLYKENSNLAQKYLLDVLNIYNKNTQINNLYTIYILDEAILLCEKINNTKLLEDFTKKKNQLNQDILLKKSEYLETLSRYNYNNELSLFSNQLKDIEDENYKSQLRLYFALIVILLIVLIFIIYRYYINQKLKLSELRIQISQDLHDEIGSTLSGLALSSDLALNELKNANGYNKLEYYLNFIKTNSRETISSLSDIVWVVSIRNETLNDMFERLLKNFTELSYFNKIQFNSSIDSSIKDLKLDIKTRKNLYFVCKEILNNSFKHSRSSLIDLKFKSISSSRIEIEIRDFGVGFSQELSNSGNGLTNIHDRLKLINAEYQLVSNETGTEYKIYINT